MIEHGLSISHGSPLGARRRPGGLVARVTLVAMEIVLGVDNLARH
jgi:predicted tellurium resistance membrane protein TerC